MDLLVLNRCAGSRRTYALPIRHDTERLRRLEDGFQPSVTTEDAVTIEGWASSDAVVHVDAVLDADADGIYRLPEGMALQGHGVTWYTVVLWLRHVGARKRGTEVLHLAKLLWSTGPSAVDRAELRRKHPLLQSVPWCSGETWKDYRDGGELVRRAVGAFDRGERNIRLCVDVYTAWSSLIDSHPRADAMRKSVQSGTSVRPGRDIRQCVQQALQSGHPVVAIHAPCAVADVCRELATVCPEAAFVTDMRGGLVNIGSHRHHVDILHACDFDVVVYVTDEDRESVGRVELPRNNNKKVVVVTTLQAELFGVDVYTPTHSRCARLLRTAMRQPAEYRCSGIAGRMPSGVRFHLPERGCTCDLDRLAQEADLQLVDAARVPFGGHWPVVYAVHNSTTTRHLMRITFDVCHLVPGPDTVV
jgi:hypothetical protein